MGYPPHFQQEFPPPTMAFTSDIQAASDPLDNICRIVDRSDSPPPALLIQTPPTPPPSPGCSQDSAGSHPSEETEINIKLATFHLLSMALNEYVQEICYGWQSGHPSQLQHSCLFELPVFFFETYYDEVMEKLRTPRFIPAIRLNAQISTHHNTINTDKQHGKELRSTIDENVGYLLNTNHHTRSVKSALLHMVGNYWSGRHKI
ncbi:POU domain transcription factor, class 4 [Sarotherodon galilaeus]